MKVHYQHPVYGLTCTTAKTRRTTHFTRVTADVARVTCETCRKQHALDATSAEASK